MNYALLFTKKKYILYSIPLLFLVAHVVYVSAMTPNQTIHACVAQANSSDRAQNVAGDANTGSVRIVSSSADCKN